MKPENEPVNEAIEKILQFDGSDFLVLDRALHTLHDEFVRITGIRGDRFEEGFKTDLLTGEGKALSPNGAAFCLFEPLRTARFLQGIIQAISDLKTNFPGEMIQIIYGGTGPYGLLLTPILRFLRDDHLNVTFIEIQKESVEALLAVVHDWELHRSVARVIHGDATSPDILPPEFRAHMVISETMLRALTTEPQVAVFLNLSSFLIENGTLIPERISVEVGLFNEMRFTRWLMRLNPPVDDEPIPESDQDSKITLATLMQLDHGFLRLHREEYRQKRSIEFPEVKVKLPEFPPGFNRVRLYTSINIYGNQYLWDRDSSITCPLSLKISRNFDFNKSKQISFQYRMGREPGFIYKNC